MAQNRRANSVIFGFDFQVNAAIVLMLENIKDLETLKLEGDYEDIELKLKNNKYILAQAKAVEQSSKDFKNVWKNLKYNFTHFLFILKIIEEDFIRKLPQGYDTRWSYIKYRY